jgi:hypothetical protein
MGFAGQLNMRMKAFQGEDHDDASTLPITGSGINPQIQRRDASRTGQHRPSSPPFISFYNDSELQQEIERLIERLRATTCPVVMMPETARGNVFSSSPTVSKIFRMRSYSFALSAPRKFLGCFPAMEVVK